MKLPFACVLVLCTVASHVYGACVSDEDCSLNGICTAGECMCDEGWTTLPEAFDTRECGQLDFLPAKMSTCGPGCAFHGGAGGIDTATSSWGGNVNRDDDGKFWLLAAEMAQSCSLSHWTTNSQVVAAVSDTAEGPYVRQNIATPPWSHNPEVIRAPDGTWVLYTLGDGAGTGRPWGPEVNCSAMPAPPPTPLTPNAQASNRLNLPKNHATPGCYPNCNFTMHTAPSPRGPWTASVQMIANWTNRTWNLGNWNPAPVMLPDGRVRIMAHTDWAGWAGETILEAPNYKGPYTVKTGDELDACAFCEEDPFMWVDKRGNWHALYHRMFDPAGPLDPNWGKEDGSWNRTGSPVPVPGWSGAHSFSRDGLTGWSPLNRCWNTTMAMTDGSKIELARRERPKLLIQDGVPTHLFNGAMAYPAPKGRDGGSITYTAVTPLNVKANIDNSGEVSTHRS